MEKLSLKKRRIPAEVCSCVDVEKSSIHLEFTIPGVRKEDIELKLNDDSFHLKADRDDVEYVSSGKLCGPAEIEKTEANYENGLLLINIPLKDPWKDAYEVIIN